MPQVSCLGLDVGICRVVKSLAKGPPRTYARSFDVPKDWWDFLGRERGTPCLLIEREHIKMGAGDL